MSLISLQLIVYEKFIIFLKFYKSRQIIIISEYLTKHYHFCDLHLFYCKQ